MLKVVAGAIAGAVTFGAATFGIVMLLSGGMKPGGGSLPVIAPLFTAVWASFLGAGLGGWWMITRG